MGNAVKVKIGNAVQPGQPVVFLCDVAFKSAAGRISYVARIGSTGKVRTINPDGTMVVDVDRKLSARRNVVENAQPDWIAAVRENVTIDEPAKENDGPSWKGFDYEDLKKIAQHHNLTWRETPNRKINTMWVIDALKKAGIQPPVAGVDPSTQAS
jgi:hypothetical protein